MRLTEIDGCVFDEKQLVNSHGYDCLDPVAREAFVNHIHMRGNDRVNAAEETLQKWVAEMRDRWPTWRFRIYRKVEEDEVTIRFHAVRHHVPNWAEDGFEIIPVGP